MRTRVKICGFTDVENAVFAAKAGVDAIGLVFYQPSPRNVEIETAIKIVNALPAFISVVALFVNEQESIIKNVLEKVSVDCLQFHGDEDPEACEIYGKRYIKAVRMRQDTNVSELARRYSNSDGLLLDAYHPSVKGGTGGRFDWDLVPRQCDLPIILAGGLDTMNINMAVQKTSPYAVDVSSGVESGKGVKDKNKIAAFMSAVQQGDTIKL
jgi:phosphoribosylanthranilate isomerase